MTSQLKILITTSAASLLACSALAQVTAGSKSDRSDLTHHGSAQERRTDRLNGAVKASELIGMDVNTYQEEKLGTVDDLGVDLESGRIVQVILSSGGFIGIGTRLTAVPPGALHHDTAKKVLHLNADKATLQGAPKFDADKWAESSSSNHLAAVYSHYGQEPAFNFVGQGEARREGQHNPADPTPDARGVVSQDNDHSGSQTRILAARQAMIPSERLGNVQRASKLIGMTVRNHQDETLGDVNNLLVDLPSGRLVAVVLSSGGFLGIADELSAVPPTALQFSTDRAGLQLDATKDRLSSAPHFNANQWPDFAQADQAGSVYGAYQVEPYFATTATTDADNTRRNEVDRNDQTLTPLDQGNNAADISTTASIRKEIGATDTMSVNAKNVKIITKDGRVTLRGPVNSAEEKRLIGEIANRIAREANVDNQLEVRITTSGL